MVGEVGERHGAREARLAPGGREEERRETARVAADEAAGPAVEAPVKRGDGGQRATAGSRGGEIEGAEAPAGRVVEASEAEREKAQGHRAVAVGHGGRG